MLLTQWSDKSSCCEGVKKRTRAERCIDASQMARHCWTMSETVFCPELDNEL